ncbi:hypothetical protein PHMEG_0004353, partial [Phytophthora megakarya]
KRVAKNNSHENTKRLTREYEPGETVLLRKDNHPQANPTPLLNGIHTVTAVRTNGTLVLDKGKYMETVHIRRVVPIKF